MYLGRNSGRSVNFNALTRGLASYDILQFLFAIMPVRVCLEVTCYYTVVTAYI